MRILSYILPIAFILLFTTAVAQTPALQKTQTHAVLFTQLAQSATIQATKKQNRYRLILNHIANNTAWFTDRPARQHGTLSTKQFVQLWGAGKNSFANNSPNANLVFLARTSQGLTETHEHIVTLTTPHYQPNKQQLSYTIEALPPIDKMHLGKTQEVALFIDSADFDFGCTKPEFWKCF